MGLGVFSMIQFGQNFHFFLACYFLIFFFWGGGGVGGGWNYDDVA